MNVPIIVMKIDGNTNDNKKKTQVEHAHGETKTSEIILKWIRNSLLYNIVLWKLIF